MDEGDCVPRSRFLPNPEPAINRSARPSKSGSGSEPTSESGNKRTDLTPKSVISTSRLLSRALGAGFVVLALAIVIVLMTRFGEGSPSSLPADNRLAENREATAAEIVSTLEVVPPSVSEQPVATPSNFRTAIVTPFLPPTELAVQTTRPFARPANELGRIPILMYHNFVHKPENTDDLNLTFDQFRGQLDWLRENDFVMVGLNSVIHREFDIPAGKRPAILTFDDSSAGQFRLQESEDGGFEVDPDTAVGVLEAYGEQYPEFAGPAFFGVLPFNCFTSKDDSSTCEERLTWLVEHGYEVGNHTYGHQDLTDVSDQRLKDEIVVAQQWLDERIEGPNNLSNVLVLPYGAYPEAAHHKALLFEGFVYEGEPLHLELVLEVGGGPVSSPYSIRWAANQMRCHTDPASFEYWADQFTNGDMQVYVSDGDPNVLTMPSGWEEYVNVTLLMEDGLTLNVVD
jgi:peptidoglycan/xylan/chitin deacetylase (PgdA/CDA1 family)